MTVDPHTHTHTPSNPIPSVTPTLGQSCAGDGRSKDVAQAVCASAGLGGGRGAIARETPDPR